MFRFISLQNYTKIPIPKRAHAKNNDRAGWQRVKKHEKSVNDKSLISKWWFNFTKF